MVNKVGYDGQFYYDLALDPVRAYHYFDVPVYRYSHILYPMLVHVVAFGNPDWVAAAMILVNLAAVCAGTFFVALLLQRDGLTPRLATFYFLFPGLLIAFSRDTTEPLAYALAAAGLVLVDDWRNPRRIHLAAAVFAAAALARETTLLIPVTIAIVHFAATPEKRTQLRRVIGFVSAVVLPYAAWRVFLTLWLGGLGLEPGGTAVVVPFGGLSDHHRVRLMCFVAVAVPVTVLLVVCLSRLQREWRQGTFTALLLSLILLGVFLPGATYTGYFDAGRLQIGTVLLALASLRSLRRNWFATQFTALAWILAYSPLILLAALLFLNTAYF